MTLKQFLARRRLQKMVNAARNAPATIAYRKNRAAQKVRAA
jgi:hypothetical protein